MKIKYDKNIAVKLMIILRIFWAVFFWLWYYFLWNIYHLVYEWEKISWTIVSVDVHESDDDTMYIPTVKYKCWDGTYTTKSSRSSSSNYKIWKTVTVYCDPKDPRNFMIKSFSNYFFFFFPLIWMVMVYGWWYEYKKSYKAKKLRKRLKLKWYGLKVKWIVKSIVFANSEIFGQKWYNINVKYNNKTYTSNTIYADINYVLKNWDEIDLYISRENTSDYWVDTDDVINKEIDMSCVEENFKSNKYPYARYTSWNRMAMDEMELEVLDSINAQLPPEKKINREEAISNIKENSFIQNVLAITKIYIWCKTIITITVLFFIISMIIDSYLEHYYWRKVDTSMYTWIIAIIGLIAWYVYYNHLVNKEWKVEQWINDNDYITYKETKNKKPLSSYIWWKLLAFAIVWVLMCWVWVFVMIYTCIVNNAGFMDIYPLFFFIALWVIILIIGIIPIYQKIKYKNYSKKLQDYWITKEWIITSIKPTWGKINNQPWYLIEVIADSKIFKSPPLYCNVHEYVSKGDHIDIYFDSLDSSKYWMDLDSIHS